MRLGVVEDVAVLEVGRADSCMPARDTSEQIGRNVHKVRQSYAKSLPGLAPIPTMPSKRRWDALIEHAHSLLGTAHDEMTCCYGERSEDWQETDNAQELQCRIDSIQETLKTLENAR